VARLGLKLGDMNTENCNVRVVLNEDRHIQQLLELLLQAYILPAFQIRGKDDSASFEIHRAGRADADTANLLQAEIGFVHGVLDAAANSLYDFIHPALRLGADLRCADAFE
jgi:hypothetical protein